MSSLKKAGIASAAVLGTAGLLIWLNLTSVMLFAVSIMMELRTPTGPN
ncbi:MAG: hypothetical protein ACI8W3_000029, partial [Myxococcota bacterium]